MNLQQATTLSAGLRDAAHVWWIQPGSVQHVAQLTACEALLSADERQRMGRFRFPEDRHTFLVSHAMLRAVLSRYTGSDPAAWHFSIGEHGRPEISGTGAGNSLRFNLSHTDGMAACVVTDSRACGVDVEKITRRRNSAGVAERMFSDAELQRLAGLSGPAWDEAFFTLWTLREAWCKARGTGLAGSGRDAGFAPDAAGDWSLAVAGGQSAATNWQFDVLQFREEYVMASAVEVDDAMPIVFDYCEFSF